MNYSFGSLAVCFGLLFMTSACKTVDILPKADLSLSAITLSETGGELELNAVLNGAATREVRIQLAFSGSATKDTDYLVNTTTIVIPPGENSGNILLTGLEDGILEGSETITIEISSLDGVLFLDTEPLTITVLDGDIDSDEDGVPDSNDNCPNISGVAENNGCPFLGFIINEVLYDPADGSAGDANLDGLRDPLNDEFIEFYNSTGQDLDISGYKIFDASALGNNEPRHIFPAGTIVPSNKSIVVFGGGTPTADFGGSQVQIASGGELNLSNAGDLITVQNAQGVAIVTFDINNLSGNPNESYTRNIDIYEDFERHSIIPEALGNIQSPGRKLNGSPF